MLDTTGFMGVHVLVQVASTILGKSYVNSASPTAPPTPESTSEESQAAGEGGGGTELKEEATGQIEGETPEQPKVREK